ncbi:MAG: hypothetical protein JXB17_00010, partial [Bacteroidales bacterium]|nr:hypothetical protein [Bacteroidales bacterium]
MSQKRIIIYIYIIIISLYIFSLFFILPGKKGFPPKVENGFLDLRDFNFDKTKYIILDNGWEFYWDKLLESADFTSEETLQPDGYTSIPSIWKELQVNGKNFSSTGYATYRINLLTNIDKKEWGILLKDFGSAVKVFINDKEITEIGKVSSTIENAIPLYNPRFVPFEAQDTVQIIVHVSNYHHRKGGFWHPPQIGPINNIRKAFLKIRFLTIFLLGSIFIIGLYHFILFIYNKQKYTPLFFGLFCIALFFRISAVNDYIISEIPGITFQKIVFFEYNSMFLAIVFFALYIYSLYPEVFHKRIIYVVIALQAIFILITLFTKTLFYTNLIIPFVYVLVLSAIYALYILIKAVLLKKDSAELFLLGFIVLLLTVMNDILNNVFVIQSVDIVSIGLFLFILIQTIALSYRYSLAFQRTDELTKELNNKNVHLEKLLSDYEKINKELTEKNEKIIVKNREIKKAKEKAVESDRLKSAFLANMSHEIRTPLNGILGFAELLKSSYYTDKRKEEFVDIINSNGNYLLSLINDIIDIAKIEAEQLKITYNSFNLIQLLAELKTVTESDKIFKEKKELLLTLDNDVKNRFFIQTDKTRLRQIIWNLLMNAVKFTNKGQINFGYELKPNNTLLFYVIDTGIGIPLDKQKLIFERFTQAHEQTVKELGGTGLGLT